jgi:hypothetical protein
MTRPTTASRRQASGNEGGPEASELRCECGNLLARWVAGGVEIKCRRCKRRVVLPVAAIGRAPPGD